MPQSAPARRAESGNGRDGDSDADFATVTIGISGGVVADRAASCSHARSRFIAARVFPARLTGRGSQDPCVVRRIASLFKLAPALRRGFSFARSRARDVAMAGCANWPPAPRATIIAASGQKNVAERAAEIEK
jgi:hypothetical protein